MLQSQLPRREKTLPLSESKVGKSAKAQAPSFAASPSRVGANKQVGGAEGAQGRRGAGRRQQCKVQCCFGGKRLLSSHSRRAGGSAVATALAVCLLTSFWLLQLFSCPASGLLCPQHRCFSRQAASVKPETDLVSACALDRTPLEGIPEAGNHHGRDAGERGDRGSSSGQNGLCLS